VALNGRGGSSPLQRTRPKKVARLRRAQLFSALSRSPRASIGERRRSRHSRRLDRTTVWVGICDGRETSWCCRFGRVARPTGAACRRSARATHQARSGADRVAARLLPVPLANQAHAANARAPAPTALTRRGCGLCPRPLTAEVGADFPAKVGARAASRLSPAIDAVRRLPYPSVEHMFAETRVRSRPRRLRC
jgi:hypothetical protein